MIYFSRTGWYISLSCFYLLDVVFFVWISRLSTPDSPKSRQSCGCHVTPVASRQSCILHLNSPRLSRIYNMFHWNKQPQTRNDLADLYVCTRRLYPGACIQWLWGRPSASQAVVRLTVVRQRQDFFPNVFGTGLCKICFSKELFPLNCLPWLDLTRCTYNPWAFEYLNFICLMTAST